MCSRLISGPSRGARCCSSPGCFTTSRRAGAATIPCSARATRAASAATTPCVRGRGPHRVAGGTPPDDVGGGPEAGHLESRSGRRIRRPRRHGAAPRRALPPHRRGHSRHEPQGVERLEGAAPRGPVPRDAPHAGRRGRTALAAGRPERPPGRCPPAAPPVRRPRGRRGQAVEAPRHPLLPAPLRRRDRVACATPVAGAWIGPSRSSRPASRRRGPDCSSWSTCPTRRSSSPASAASSARAACRFSRRRCTRRATAFALDTFLVHDPANPNASYREAIQFIEHELVRVLVLQPPLEPPGPGA